MITRIRPDQPWSFDEKLAIVSIGAAGSARRATLQTKVPASKLLEDLGAALAKLPRTDLMAPAETLAVLWWRGASRALWQDATPSGGQPSADPATLWDDDAERLTQRYKLARGDLLSQIVDDAERLRHSLPED